MSSNNIVYDGNNKKALSTFDDGIAAIDRLKQLHIEKMNHSVIIMKQKYSHHRYELDNIEKGLVKKIMDQTSQCIARLDQQKAQLQQKKYEMEKQIEIESKLKDSELEKRRLARINDRHQKRIQELQMKILDLEDESKHKSKKKKKRKKDKTKKKSKIKDKDRNDPEVPLISNGNGNCTDSMDPSSLSMIGPDNNSLDGIDSRIAILEGFQHGTSSIEPIITNDMDTIHDINNGFSMSNGAPPNTHSNPFSEMPRFDVMRSLNNGASMTNMTARPLPSHDEKSGNSSSDSDDQDNSSSSNDDHDTKIKIKKDKHKHRSSSKKRKRKKKKRKRKKKRKKRKGSIKSERKYKIKPEIDKKFKYEYYSDSDCKYIEAPKRAPARTGDTDKTWLYCRHKKFDGGGICGLKWIRRLKDVIDACQHNCDADPGQDKMTRTFGKPYNKCQYCDGTVACIRYATLDEIHDHQTKMNDLGLVPNHQGGYKKIGAKETLPTEDTIARSPAKRRSTSPVRKKRKLMHNEDDEYDDGEDDYEPRHKLKMTEWDDQDSEHEENEENDYTEFMDENRNSRKRKRKEMESDDEEEDESGYQSKYVF